jgi:hypothetical protein
MCLGGEAGDERGRALRQRAPPVRQAHLLFRRHQAQARRDGRSARYVGEAMTYRTLGLIDGAIATADAQTPSRSCARSRSTPSSARPSRSRSQRVLRLTSWTRWCRSTAATATRPTTRPSAPTATRASTASSRARTRSTACSSPACSCAARCRQARAACPPRRR